jgi:hypothetical protein
MITFLCALLWVKFNGWCDIPKMRGETHHLILRPLYWNYSQLGGFTLCKATSLLVPMGIYFHPWVVHGIMYRVMPWEHSVDPPVKKNGPSWLVWWAILKWKLQKIPLAENRFLQAGKGAKEKSRHSFTCIEGPTTKSLGCLYHYN